MQLYSSNLFYYHHVGAVAGKTAAEGEVSPAIQNNQVSPGDVSTNNVEVNITSDKLDIKTTDAATKGSRSSTASSLQSLDTGTCHLTDVDNMPIMTVTDVKKAMSGESQTPPDGSFVFLSNDAAAIMASTPELNPNLSSSPVDVIRREGSRQGAERPISLDLETLPEGVSAHSLFAELSVQEPDIIGQVDTGADITAMVGELDTVLKENKELVTAK